ncbi:hypothetical protein DF186_14990, partial [Enterococcus hirae]
AAQLLVLDELGGRGPVELAPQGFQIDQGLGPRVVLPDVGDPDRSLLALQAGAQVGHDQKDLGPRGGQGGGGLVGREPRFIGQSQLGQVDHAA